MKTWALCVGVFWFGALLGAIGRDEEWVLAVPTILTVITVLFLALRGLGLQ